MTDKATPENAKAAIAGYIAEHAPAFDGAIPMSDLRSYVRSKTGGDFGGPTLAKYLKAMGYRRDGERKIDTCPGKTVFWVKA